MLLGNNLARGVYAKIVDTSIEVSLKTISDVVRVFECQCTSGRDKARFYRVEHGAVFRGCALHVDGNVVLLSSWGAELPEKSGGIIGCHWFEHLLDEIPGLNVVYLRPVWFMENFLFSTGLIKMAGINGLAINPSVPFPTIASRDIASVAADYLANLNFNGRNVHYLNGPRDYTMIEVNRILGRAIGKRDLKYVEFPEGVLRKGLVGSGGLSPNAADLLIETNQGINSGLIKAVPSWRPVVELAHKQSPWRAIARRL